MAEEEEQADKNKCLKPPERARGQKLPMTYVGELLKSVDKTSTMTFFLPVDNKEEATGVQTDVFLIVLRGKTE